MYSPFQKTLIVLTLALVCWGLVGLGALLLSYIFQAFVGALAPLFYRG